MDYSYYYAAAREVLDWTALHLSPENMQWLRVLPYQRSEGEVTYGHASPREPEAFEYIFALEQAEDLLARTGKLAQLTFIGHSHLQRAFQLGNPVRDVWAERVRVDSARRYLISIGSCGQPRDYDPRACYGIWDDQSRTVEFHRSSTTPKRPHGRSSRQASPRTRAAAPAWGLRWIPQAPAELEALTRGQIEALLSLAAGFKRERAKARSAGESPADRRGLLRGRNVITLFFESSTRTRSSFEVAAKALGADVLSFQKTPPASPRASRSRTPCAISTPSARTRWWSPSRGRAPRLWPAPCGQA